ncbi:Gfo/Idh/MocA family protein [Paenibacillus hodogayensis]|uniref:Gfo/Idh/MocA family protein n=1 Tax=Paenibacillus hodogayensis TaxID=279208 RepID=A0ABV5VVH3_9BACL
MNKLKVGMISFAHGHANSYLHSLLTLPQAEVVAIADEVKSRVEGSLDKYGIDYYADYRDLLAKADIDAVVICSENALHAQHVIAAAKAKKHVICEKPLGIDVNEMEQMIAVCQENGVELFTAFPCRYLAAVVNAKQAVDNGEIGDILAIKGTNRGTMPGKWFVEPELSGGGALLDHTVHVMDLMNWITGSKVTDVYAYAATLFHEGLKVDDAGMISVRFENGVVGVLDTSWSRPKVFPTWGDVTMEIVGTKGTISVDSFAQKNELFSNEIGRGLYLPWSESMDYYMIESFVDALLQGKPAPVSGLDGLRSAEVALAGYRSVQSGQPVKLHG